MRNHSPYTLVVFSTDRAGRDDNLERAATVADLLHREGVPFLVTDGRYNGTAEHGFAAILPACPEDIVYLERLGIVTAICRATDQESYLVVNPERTGELVYLADGRRERLGYAEYVFEQPDASSWTHFPTRRQWMIVC